MNEEQTFALEDETDRLFATWDARRMNIPPDTDAVCSSCDCSHPFVLFLRAGRVLCYSCDQDEWKQRRQEQHLGRKPTPLSPVPADANEQLLLTDLQRLWVAAGFKPGSWFAIGFDIGAYIVISGNV